MTVAGVNVPDAELVAAAFVVALEPVTVEADAVDVAAAFVVAEVPATPCAPDADDVNAAKVCADVPVTVELATRCSTRTTM